MASEPPVGEDLSRQNGYYIYYEKNPMMQNYLVERRQDIKEVQTYEKMMESRRDEKLIRQFREKISKKTKSNQRKGRIRNISTAAAVTIMMIMGGTMYYYAGQDQSINFKDVVNGAVHTMGKGVSDQISTKSSSTTSVKITKTLDTATQTSTHKKNAIDQNLIQIPTAIGLLYAHSESVGDAVPVAVANQIYPLCPSLLFSIFIL